MTEKCWDLGICVVKWPPEAAISTPSMFLQVRTRHVLLCRVTLCWSVVETKNDGENEDKPKGESEGELPRDWSRNSRRKSVSLLLEVVCYAVRF